ncbi:MAG TPA: hypothetical protein VMD30_05720, partial [Tepidisphaeraceae bacterium]|nr:hypothetical protein [Tepidisphaeraceae bacterium]
CSAIAILIPRWDSGPETLKEAAKSAIDPSNWLFMWACFVGIKAIHELGHAFSCRRFGGECHELGLMLLVFIPTPYVDASSAWTFPSKWQRAFVGAAGMIVELFVASIMAFIWANTTPHQLIHQLAYNCMFIASVSTILFNANPLLRYDGYYILSDLLEIPNLRQKSVEYSLGIIKRHIFRIKLQQPLPPVGQRVWLLLYSIASGLYRIFIGVMIVVIVAFKVPILGVLMAIGGIVTWAGVPLYQVTKYLALEPELHRKRGRAIFFCSSVAACLVVLIGFVPFRVYVRAQGILEAADHQTINAPYPGFVEMTANNGQWLKKGDIILKADNPNLDEEIASYRADLERDIATEQAALGSSDMATYQEAVADFQATNATLQKDLKYQNDLTIRATIDGQLVAPDIHQLIGSYLQVGKTQIGTVVAPGDLQADCVVDINDASLARRWKLTASQVEVRPVSDFSTKLPVKRIDPFPSETTDINPLLGTQGGGNVEMVQQDGSPIVGPVDPSEKIRARVMQSIIRLTLANPDDEFLPGQRVYVRVTLEKEPLIWQWSRWFMQLIQQHDTGKWI